MRVLILTMNCGDGHNKIAEAIKKGFGSGDTAEVFDSFGANEKLKYKEHKAFLFLTTHFPKIYDFVWNKMRKKDPKNRYSLINTSYIKNIYDYNLKKIEEFKPDAIICTHNYTSNLCCKLKQDGKINVNVYSVLFDYTVCPFWESSILCDAIFTPHELTHSEMISRGFTSSQLVCTGFPVSPEFQTKLDREKEREKFGFTKDDFVVMSMSGGFGQGDSMPLVRQLAKIQKVGNKNLIAYILCGKNEKRKAKIEKYIKKHHLEHIKACGYLPRVDDLMSACDVIFTRGGGGTLSECLEKGIVPIIREKLLISEKINKNLFMNRKLAYGIKKIKEVPPLLKVFHTKASQ